MDGRRRFFAIQAVMIAFSLFTHGWMVWRGYLEDGPLWAAGYLLLFVYAEAYWAYRSLIADGVTPCFICNARCAAWWNRMSCDSRCTRRGYRAQHAWQQP